MRRQPEALADATIQPIMFVLLFAFVFGGAIARARRRQLQGVPDGRDLRPDDRLRLPSASRWRSPTTARTARSTASTRCRSRARRVLAGHAVASLHQVAAADRVHVGHRAHRSAGGSTPASSTRSAAYGLMIVFSFASSGSACCWAASSRRPRRVQGIAFVAIFPITFVASTFVPTSTLPGVAADVRRVEPGRRRWPTRCATCSATRAARSRPRAVVAAAPDPVHADLGGGVVVVCAPLAVRQYQRSIRS